MNELYLVLLALGLALVAIGLLVSHPTGRIAAFAIAALAFVVAGIDALGVIK
jgi:hypothetical protein